MGRLNFIMEILVPGKTVFLLRRDPGFLDNYIPDPGCKLFELDIIPHSKQVFLLFENHIDIRGNSFVDGFQSISINEHTM